MPYDSEVMRRAEDRFSLQRQQNEAKQDALRRELFSRSPALASVSRELSSSMVEFLSRSLSPAGENPEASLAALKEKNALLTSREAELLLSLGYPADALTEKPLCPRCNDTGWSDGHMCGCLKTICIEEQLKVLGSRIDIENQTFDNFSLGWYSKEIWLREKRSPYANMEIIYEVCLNYAEKFNKYYFPNLLLTGDPGLGKTFLSACIAKVVAEKGFSVVYDTASQIFSDFETRKFLRASEEGKSADIVAKQYLNCDLLLVDDLGSEFTTPFVQSALYTLINTRLTRRKNTVISTNLSMDGIRERYSGQIASRLEGEYNPLRFYGEDIRRKKKI